MATTSPTNDRVPHGTRPGASKHDGDASPNLDLTMSRSLNSTDPHQATIQPFRFFDLPTETRCMILSHAVEFKSLLRHRPPHPDITQQLIDIRLLATNHQMYEEASQILYGRNTFQWILFNIAYDGMPNWVAHPEQFTRHLRRFRIILSDYWTKWYPKYQEEVDEVIKTLALCQRLELVEVVYLFYSQPIFHTSHTVEELFPTPSPATIKKYLDFLSGISGKRVLYRQDLASQKYRSGCRDARSRNNLALSAELIDIDGLSTE